MLAKVRAKNLIGFSEFSQENTTGATIQIEPAQVSPLRINNEISSVTSIGLDWDALITSD